MFTNLRERCWQGFAKIPFGDLVNTIFEKRSELMESLLLVVFSAFGNPCDFRDELNTLVMTFLAFTDSFARLLG